MILADMTGLVQDYLFDGLILVGLIAILVVIIFLDHLKSRQRKLAYLGMMVALTIPIIYLGMPSTPSEGQEGGELAQLRTEYKLGESTLGDVDPASSTMNLVLLGFRGIAASMLWLDAKHYQKTKDWTNLNETVKSIIQLQPHFKEVWSFQGWNLAFNVSVEMDAVEDRFFWVKEGAKFCQDGTRRNRDAHKIYWDVGRIKGFKIGQSDEWEYYRKFFVIDPDVERFNGGPDREINPDELDNYLEAKRWFQRHNDTDVHKRASVNRRSYPARAQFDYASTRQREGKFDETTRLGWEQAYEDWTQKFGQERFMTNAGELFLEATDGELEVMAKERKVDVEVLKNRRDSYRQTCNYNFWKAAAKMESRPEITQAHKNIFEAKHLYKQGKTSPSLVRPAVDFCSRLDDLTLTNDQHAIAKIICASQEPLSRQEIVKKSGMTSTATNKVIAELEEDNHVQRVSKAQLLLESGMLTFERQLQNAPELGLSGRVLTDDEAELVNKDRDHIEALLEAILYWRSIHELNGREIPKTYPLKSVWDSSQELVRNVKRQFYRENGMAAESE